MVLYNVISAFLGGKEVTVGSVFAGGVWVRLCGGSCSGLLPWGVTVGRGWALSLVPTKNQRHNEGAVRGGVGKAGDTSLGQRGVRCGGKGSVPQSTSMFCTRQDFCSACDAAYG